MYQGMKEIAVNVSWQARVQSLHNSQRSGSLRVFFMGTDEQQDKSGFLQALQRFSEVRCFIREDGSWGQNDPSPYHLRRIRNTQRLEALLDEHAREGWIPQLLIVQTWACLVEPACFSRLRQRYGLFIINIAMDDRHQYWGSKVSGEWSGTYPLIPHIDMTLTAAPEAVNWYRKEGGAALFFPEASDPDIFFPMPELPKIHDVSFVGSCYGLRAELVAALRKAEIGVSAYGNGWDGGRIDNESVPALFAQSKIILGVSAIGHSRDFVGLKLRDFDAPVSGSCYITQHNQDLGSLYRLDKEIVTYRDVSDCVRKVRMLLGDKKLREEIAAAGRTRALENHTWDARFRTLFEAFGSE